MHRNRGQTRLNDLKNVRPRRQKSLSKMYCHLDCHRWVKGITQPKEKGTHCTNKEQGVEEITFRNRQDPKYPFQGCCDSQFTRRSIRSLPTATPAGQKNAFTARRPSLTQGQYRTVTWSTTCLNGPTRTPHQYAPLGQEGASILGADSGNFRIVMNNPEQGAPTFNCRQTNHCVHAGNSFCALW